MNQLKEILNESYILIRVIKKTDDKSITIYRHKQLQKDMVVREFNGNGAAYRTIMRITHPGIEPVYDVLESNGKVTVLEQYIDGIPLNEMLNGKCMNTVGAKKIALQLTEALSVIHSLKIVHRDIKPENILIKNDGTLVLIDFDAARVYKSGVQRDTVVLGTVGYAAPEQFGIEQSDFRADIFAFGILINVLLTGEHPSKKICKGKFKRVVEKCTQIDPDKRYQTMTDLQNAVIRI